MVQDLFLRMREVSDKEADTMKHLKDEYNHIILLSCLPNCLFYAEPSVILINKEVNTEIADLNGLAR